MPLAFVTAKTGGTSGYAASPCRVPAVACGAAPDTIVIGWITTYSGDPNAVVNMAVGGDTAGTTAAYADTAWNGANQRCRLYFWKGTGPGTVDVDFSWTGSVAGSQAGVIVWSGADTLAAVALAVVLGATNTPSVTVASAANDRAVGIFIHQETGNSAAASAEGQLRIDAIDSGFRAFVLDEPGSTSVTVNGTTTPGLVYPAVRWSFNLVAAASSAATAVTLIGPSSGTVGSPSTNFTVGANGTITGTVTVTPSDSGGGGTFTPASVDISAGSPTATFTYTAGSAGSKSISVTNNGGLTNPSAISFTASNPPATKIDLTIPAAAGLTGIRWAVFGAAALSGGAAAIASGNAESFDGSGLISLDISGLGVAIGAVRYVVLTQSNGDPAQSPIPYGWHGPATAS